MKRNIVFVFILFIACSVYAWVPYRGSGGQIPSDELGRKCNCKEKDGLFQCQITEGEKAGKKGLCCENGQTCCPRGQCCNADQTCCGGFCCGSDQCCVNGSCQAKKDCSVYNGCGEVIDTIKVCSNVKCDDPPPPCHECQSCEDGVCTGEAEYKDCPVYDECCNETGETEEACECQSCKCPDAG